MTDAQNDVNIEPGVPPQRPPNVLNIPRPDTASKPDDPSWEEIDRVMRESATEAQVEATRAIEGMKKDKELWNRVQQLKDARHTKRHSQENNLDSDNCRFLQFVGVCVTYLVCCTSWDFEIELGLFQDMKNIASSITLSSLKNR